MSQKLGIVYLRQFGIDVAAVVFGLVKFVKAWFLKPLIVENDRNIHISHPVIRIICHTSIN